MKLRPRSEPASRVIGGVVADERPGDMQEFVHQNDQSLHGSKRVLRPLLEMLVVGSKSLIGLHQTQASKVKDDAETSPSFAGDRRGRVGFLARLVGRGLDAGQFDQLLGRGKGGGVADFGQ